MRKLLRSYYESEHESISADSAHVSSETSDKPSEDGRVEKAKELPTTEGSSTSDAVKVLTKTETSCVPT